MYICMMVVNKNIINILGDNAATYVRIPIVYISMYIQYACTYVCRIVIEKKVVQYAMLCNTIHMYYKYAHSIYSIYVRTCVHT